MKIVYTPIHGTGNIPVRRVLKEIGFEQVYVVEEQEKPDGDFPTVEYPNPEDARVFELALKKAKEVGAELILATDPDADRLGIYALDKHTGDYVAFTGNMSGVLLCDYILSQKKAKGTLAPNSAIVTTIVTTNMADAIAEYYGVELFKTLTGFKYIGEKIKEFEENQSYQYEFGFEESYGCLVGTHARDKDAVVTVMSLCEAAAYYKGQGKTLVDQMELLYQKFGYYKEDLQTKVLQGEDGAKQINQMIEAMRTNIPTELAGIPVISMTDYRIGQKLILASGMTEAVDLPESNVLYFELENGCWYTVRPSGTEPKIKYYFGVKADSAEKANQLLEDLKAL